jgi:hypothetical protein
VLSRVSLSVVVGGVALFLAGLAAHAFVALVTRHPAQFAAVALFGLLVGTTELVSRYRDKPVAPLGTWPGVIYVATNTVASVAALWILLQKGVTFDFGGMLPPDVGRVLLAGFGTMVLFRSSLFTVRVGDTDVSIGPAAVLQIILGAADRACDRLRAGPRSERVQKIMRGVSFERAKLALPLHCFSLMQNVSTAEQTQVLQTIDALATKSMSDEVKAYNLGLLMMNVVGEDVLDKAVSVLGPPILGPPSDDPPILAQASTIKPDDMFALVDICVALDPLGRVDKPAKAIREEIAATIEDVKVVSDKNLVALALLRSRFGSTTVARALALLASGREPAGTLVKQPQLSPASFTPGGATPSTVPSAPPPAEPPPSGS